MCSNFYWSHFLQWFKTCIFALLNNSAVNRNLVATHKSFDFQIATPKFREKKKDKNILFLRENIVYTIYWIQFSIWKHEVLNTKVNLKLQALNKCQFPNCSDLIAHQSTNGYWHNNWFLSHMDEDRSIYRVTSYTWPCVSGALLKVTWSVYG